MVSIDILPWLCFYPFRYVLREKQTFNDVPALDGGPNPASAAAMEPTTVYVIRREDLRKLFMTRPEVAEAVVQNLASSLRHLVMLVENLSLHHVTARVAKILLDQEEASQQAQHPYHLTQTEFSAFHVIGAIFSDTYADGNRANHMVGNQTVTIPPGGGMAVELTIPQAGLYPFLTHSFSAVDKGAVGILKVTP